MDFFSVKNWDELQHYKDRAPPWIKLYNHLLDDYEFACLQDASKLHLVLIWLLASRNNNRLPFNARWIKQRIGVDGDVDLNELAAMGFIEVDHSKDAALQSQEHNASTVLADCKQVATTEERRGEGEKSREREEGEKKNISASPLSGKPDMKLQAKAAIDYLNLKIGSKYRHAESNLKLLVARLKEGHTLKDITDVIDAKAKEWPPGDPQFKYLRPATLFNAEKFNQYVGQVGMDVSGVGVDPVMAQREAAERARRIALGIDPDPSEKIVGGEVLSEMTAIEYNQLLEH